MLDVIYPYGWSYHHTELLKAGVACGISFANP